MNQIKGLRMLRATLLLLFCSPVLLSLQGCGGGGGGGGSGGDAGGGNSGPSAVDIGQYFPLTVGATWSYRSSASPSTVSTMRMTAATSVGGVAGTTGVLYDGTATSPSDFVLGSDGLWQYPGAGETDPLTLAIGAYAVMRRNPVAGQSFVQFDKTISTVDIDGDRIADKVVARSVVTVSGFESVTTPAGSFTNCLHLHTTIGESVTVSSVNQTAKVTVDVDDWYAPGVGLVRSTTKTSGLGSADGSETQNLVAFHANDLRSETVAPQAQSTLPASDSTGGNALVVSASFSEAMDPLSLINGGFIVKDANGQAVAGSLQFDGNTVTFVPTQPWASGTYAAVLSAAAEDQAGNSLGNPRSWTFVADLSGPAVISTSPVNQASEIALDAPITIVFNEPVDPASIDGQSIVLSGLPSLSFAVNGATVTVTPQNPLTPGTLYTLAVGASFGHEVRDLVGNKTATAYVSTFRTSQGRFGYPTAIDASLQGLNAQLVADVDGDGIPDLVYIGSPVTGGSNALYLLRGLGQGQFAPARTISPGAGACLGGYLALADMNSDGRKDLVLGGDGGCGVQVLLQDADSQFVPGMPLPIYAAAALRVADLDGDGRPEIVTLDPNGLVRIGHLSADLLSVSTTVIDLRTGGHDFLSVFDALAIGDVDGDGRPDILTGGNDQQNGQLIVLRQAADGSFGNGEFHVFPGADSIADIAVADLDGDGRKDVIVGNSSSGPPGIGIFHQQSDGTLAAARTLGMPDNNYIGALSVADIDGDGRLDIVAIPGGAWPLAVLLQQADGSFAMPMSFSAPYGTVGLSLVDLDGDGLIDIVVDGQLIRQMPQGPRSSASRWPVVKSLSSIGTKAAAASRNRR